MNHGYARCSTNESKQDIDRQVRELKQAGAESIFLEYEHGDSMTRWKAFPRTAPLTFSCSLRNPGI